MDQFREKSIDWNATYTDYLQSFHNCCISLYPLVTLLLCASFFASFSFRLSILNRSKLMADRIKSKRRIRKKSFSYVFPLMIFSLFNPVTLITIGRKIYSRRYDNIFTRFDCLFSKINYRTSRIFSKQFLDTNFSNFELHPCVRKEEEALEFSFVRHWNTYSPPFINPLSYHLARGNSSPRALCNVDYKN